MYTSDWTKALIFRPFLPFVITFFQLQTCLPTCPILPSCTLLSSTISILYTPLFEQLRKIQSCANLRTVPLENLTNSNSAADHWELLSVKRVSSQVCIDFAIVFQDCYWEKSGYIKDFVNSKLYNRREASTDAKWIKVYIVVYLTDVWSFEISWAIVRQ